MFMSFFGPLIISSIAGLSTILGAFVIFFQWKTENINKFITFALSLSLIIMIGISITELIPEASYTILTDFKLAKGIFISLIAFLIGVYSIYKINKKIEKKSSNNHDLRN